MVAAAVVEAAELAKGEAELEAGEARAAASTELLAVVVVAAGDDRAAASVELVAVVVVAAEESPPNKDLAAAVLVFVATGVAGGAGKLVKFVLQTIDTVKPRYISNVYLSRDANSR